MQAAWAADHFHLAIAPLVPHTKKPNFPRAQPGQRFSWQGSAGQVLDEGAAAAALRRDMEGARPGKVFAAKEVTARVGERRGSWCGIMMCCRLVQPQFHSRGLRR